ncbi:hypothetical protein D3C83_125640 [compost metagenome]
MHVEPGERDEELPLENGQVFLRSRTAELPLVALRVRVVVRSAEKGAVRIGGVFEPILEDQSQRQPELHLPDIGR